MYEEEFTLKEFNPKKFEEKLLERYGGEIVKIKGSDYRVLEKDGREVLRYRIIEGENTDYIDLLFVGGSRVELVVSHLGGKALIVADRESHLKLIEALLKTD